MEYNDNHRERKELKKNTHFSVFSVVLFMVCCSSSCRPVSRKCLQCLYPLAGGQNYDRLIEHHPYGVGPDDGCRKFRMTCHQLVDAGTGQDIAGGSASVNMAYWRAGQFQIWPIETPVVLLPGHCADGLAFFGGFGCCSRRRSRGGRRDSESESAKP